MGGHRFTMVLVKTEGGYRRAEFDLVRFNVDENPDAEQDIVPVGVTDRGKIFEHVMKTDSMPFSKKTSFEG
jgi:hypothetical protein